MNSCSCGVDTYIEALAGIGHTATYGSVAKASGGCCSGSTSCPVAIPMVVAVAAVAFFAGVQYAKKC
jgi:hypothetical protein